ncbi:MAG: hypothetical protein O7173_03235 [Wolbachia endosymbiont of Nomada fabriciana]|uniref:hypothetical protein n=1 Tax=unclassified Wolbachia TaxID=2640676 RepID=UPI0007EECE42|nr:MULTISPECIES: hypothetical protein [unclassified Wolbachia]MDX5496654.1 hypothetical protein [Wolbachia endosymbiont of Nomada fabriciana]MDX5507391.1 hypothetical protein [Wolbachia endosymbiont of Hylaeus sinuatus]MDX5527796.1 hypothetical protein [Wolbachia endosymbiont of Andrena minutula]
MRNNDEDTELIQDLLNGDCDELNRKVGLFLDQCPSFLHSVGRSRFFPAFFFGMFATAFDSGIIDFDPDIANGERIYFRFDNYDNGKGNLKIAVLTNDVDEDGMRIVRCYTIADNENSPGSRFSEEERLWIEENQLQHLQEDLAWEEYKIFQRGEECVFFPQGRDFNGNHASPIDNFREIAPIMQQGNLLDRANGLANNNSQEVRRDIRRILQYIVNVYDAYRQELNFDSESDDHGFLSGFLVNFRYRAMADIYLELLIGRGYADITLLVRGQEKLNNSVPIIIELKAGQEHAGQALEQARGYVRNCPISSVSAHTSSRNAVCVGLNFNHNAQRLQLDAEHFLEQEPSLIKRLLNPTEREVARDVENYLLYPASCTRAVPGSSPFSYTSRFAFASIAFEKGTARIGRDLVRVTKYLFNYHNDDRMLGQQGQRIARINVRERALTMVLFALSINSLVVLNIRQILRHQFPVMALDLLRPHWQGARVHEVLCEMIDDNPQVNVILTPFQSPDDYSRNYLGHFQGDLLRIGGVGQVHRAASVMMNTGWQDVNRHTELFQEISNVLFPLRQALVTSEAEFQAVLHGLFYTLGNPARVIIEFQLERGGRIDLVLSRFVERDDTHPIGIELKFARTAGQIRQKSAEANRQLQRYTQCGGCERITDGDQMVLSYAVFNNGARGPDTLISVRDVLNVRDNLGQFYR